MRKLLFSLLTLSALLLTFSSCKKTGEEPEPQKTPRELAIDDLTGGSAQVWTVSDGGSVSRDGRSETTIYQGFEIEFAANQASKTYTTTNANDLFDGSGNWDFVGENLDKIILTGTRPAAGNEISYTRSGSNDLRLQFTIAVPGARTEAVAGNYVFNLKRK